MSNEENKKQNPIWGILLVGLFVLAAIYLFRPPDESAATPTNTPRPAAVQQPSTVKVTYRITGTTIKADFTIENETGNTEQGVADNGGQQFNRKAWEKTFAVPLGTFVYISAQNDRETGTIGCEIEIDGIVQEQAESTGAYAIATCSGNAGR